MIRRFDSVHATLDEWRPTDHAGVEVLMEAPDDLGAILRSSTAFAPSAEQRSVAVAQVLKQMESFDPRGPAKNFPVIDDDSEFFTGLYAAFVRLCDVIVGPFDLAPDNSPTCWALCVNKETINLPFHNHQRTAHVNGVYYLELPQTRASEGGLLVRSVDGSVSRIAPRTGDLMIFDPSVDHAPELVSSPQSRISINVELMVNDAAEIRTRLGNLARRQS